MTVFPGQQLESGSHPGLLPESSSAISGLSDWEVEFHQGVTGQLELFADDTVPAADNAVKLTISGVGDVSLRPSEPERLQPDAVAAHIWVNVELPFEEDRVPELLLLLSDGSERTMGQLDFVGWHQLQSSLPASSRATLTGLAVRGISSGEETELILGQLAIETGPEASLDPIPTAVSPYVEPLSMLPQVAEEVTTSLEKDGISFIFEARSLTAVVRYVYTPIEGNLSDVEIEVNNAESIKLSEGGGVLIDMGGQEWAADDEEVERHFVSCEQVDEVVEARWQWRRGDELADFLYRLTLSGKSLVVEIEGGNGKATGIDLGYTAGAVHPRLIRVPYFSFGDEAPFVLCSSGVFISSFIDWFSSAASSLSGAPARDESQELRINGGCRYEPASNGKRNALKERWILTVSRDFEETLPSFPEPTRERNWDPLQGRVWYNIPRLDPSEEAYVESYERLRTFKQRGLDHLLVIHPPETWRDSRSGGGLTLESAKTKGGDDALLEYLEAVNELGYLHSLFVSSRDISPTDTPWSIDAAARQSTGSYQHSGPGRYLLKPSRTPSVGPDHVSSVKSKFGNDATYLAHHTATPPWERVDFDARLADPASFRATLLAEHAAISSISDAAGDAIVGDGGSHWLYRGLLPGYAARLAGPTPGRQPLLVDFDLKHLHPVECDAGVGTPSEFFGEELSADDMHGRSAHFDHYLAATIAFGHAGYLPDLDDWGLEAVVKYYFMIQHLQTLYLGTPVSSILYHSAGQLLETSEALVSGAYENSQLQIGYANGLILHVNGSWTTDWEIDIDGATCQLAPGSFHAGGLEGAHAYSADLGNGRIDFARCDDYFYCDTRGQTLETDGLTVNGAVLLRQDQWIIDVYPIDCQTPITIEPSKLWPERRMPKLRVLAYQDDDDEPQVINANASDSVLVLEPAESIYKFRITLPEWMVEPGQ